MNLNGKPGELHITLEITRAATGKTDTVQLIGTMMENPDGEEDAWSDGSDDWPGGQDE